MDEGRTHGKYHVTRPVVRRGGRPGQSAVEFALAIPVFCALLFGSIEMGLLFKTRAAYQEAAQEAVRVAAAAGNATNADAQTLSQLQSMLPVENLNKISSVQIFDATVGAPVSATTSYTYSAAQNAFVCAATGVSPAITPCTSSWDPLLRNTIVGSLDHIGIRIQYIYKGVTGLLPSQVFTQTAATLIEPNSFAP